MFISDHGKNTTMFTAQNQVKKMQETASLKSVFPSNEYCSGAMGSVTIASKEYDVWKVGQVTYEILPNFVKIG
jgi:hypothetical protein